jgi:sugar phosphate isomerase/epimerase
MHARLLPGEGEADPAGMLRDLDAAGCRAPVGIEVFSDRLNALPAREAAKLAADAGRALLAAVRGA